MINLTPIVQFSLMYGGVVALLSLAFTLTHASSGFPNMSLGTLMGVGMISSFLLAEGAGLNLLHGLPLVFMLGGLVNGALFHMVFRRIDERTEKPVLMTLAGLGLLLVLPKSLTIMTYWLRGRVESDMWCGATYLSENRGELHLHFYKFDTSFLGLRYSVIASLLLVALASFTAAYLMKRRFGIVFRAYEENPSLAAVNGVDPVKVQLVAWFIAGGLAAAAGSILPLWSKGYPGTVAPFMIAPMMAGSFIGGIDSLLGSLAGGFAVGFLDITLTTWGQEHIGVWVGEYRQIFAVIFLLLAFIIRQK